MALVSFTIPDAIVPRVLDAIAMKFDYAGTQLPGETKAQFAKRKIKETVKSWVVSQESDAGFASARATAETDIDIQD